MYFCHGIPQEDFLRNRALQIMPEAIFRLDAWQFEFRASMLTLSPNYQSPSVRLVAYHIKDFHGT